MYDQIMKDLEAFGTEQNRKVYKRHGMDLELFGVSIANIKKLAMTYKGHFKEGLQLLKSGNHDAMYLSQYLIDPSDITKELLEAIALSTDSHSVHETILANLGVMNKDITINCITSWITHEDFRLRRTAWALYSNGLSYLPNEMFDEEDLLNKLNYVKEHIYEEENYVKYVMNGFVIAVGAYVPNLTLEAKLVAEAVGKVEVFMGQTSCKVPFAPDYIQKIENMDRIGRKRKQLC